MGNKLGSRFQKYKEFKVTGNKIQDGNYTLLLTRYFDSVQDGIKDILTSDKNMKRKEADIFLQRMFSLGQQRMKQLKELVTNCYDNGMTSDECAGKVIDNFYNITKINKYDNSSDYDEVTEVTEKVATNFYHWKQVSPSLFWNFIQRVNKLGVKFIFDISYINKMDNSLNHKDFSFYMETPLVDDKVVEYEFQYSKLLSKIIKVLDTNKYSGTGIKFFIGIDKNNILKFGYLFNDKRYTIGGFTYKSSDISKLNQFVKISNNDIDIYQLSKKFKTTLWFVCYYKNIMKAYLQQYNDSLDGEIIDIYVSIINNKLALVIDSSDGNTDIINKKYLEHILQSNIDNKLKRQEFSVEKLEFKGKTHYYIIIK